VGKVKTTEFADTNVPEKKGDLVLDLAKAKESYYCRDGKEEKSKESGCVGKKSTIPSEDTSRPGNKNPGDSSINI